MKKIKVPKSSVLLCLESERRYLRGLDEQLDAKKREMQVLKKKRDKAARTISSLEKSLRKKSDD